MKSHILRPLRPAVDDPAALKALLLQKDRQILDLMKKVEELQHELNNTNVHIDDGGAGGPAGGGAPSDQA